MLPFEPKPDVRTKVAYTRAVPHRQNRTEQQGKRGSMAGVRAGLGPKPGAPTRTVISRGVQGRVYRFEGRD